MKIKLSDICSLCCPRGLRLRPLPPGMGRRLKARVMEELQEGGAKRAPRRYLRIFAAAALIAGILGGAAFAAAGIIINRRRESGIIIDRDELFSREGELISSEERFINDVGMTLTIMGPEGDYYLPEFRPGWCPSEPDELVAGSEGWMLRMADGAGRGLFPYCVSVHALYKGENIFTVCGKPDKVEEKYLGSWYMLSISSDTSENKYYRFEGDRLNTVLLYDSGRSWLISLTGTDSLRTLKGIAEELEIRQSGELMYEQARGRRLSMLLPARG